MSTTQATIDKVKSLHAQKFSQANIIRQTGITEIEYCAICGIDPADLPELATEILDKIDQDELAADVSRETDEDPDPDAELAASAAEFFPDDGETPGMDAPIYDWINLVDMGQVRENPYQTRSAMDQDELAELAADIEANGLLQPPIGRMVWYDGDEKTVLENCAYEPAQLAGYLAEPNTVIELAFGHRRFRACQQIGFEQLPITLRPLSDVDMARHAWAENAKRQDIMPLDAAFALQRMGQAFNWSNTEIGDEVGLSRSAVSNKIRLLQLPPDALAGLASGELSERHGRALLRLMPMYDADTLIDNLASDTIKKGHSARQLEDIVNKLIYALEPVLEKPTHVTRQWASGDKPEDPPFPVDWDALEDRPDESDKPEDQRRFHNILGPCTGCAHRARFGGESYDRCQISSGWNECINQKRSLWDNIRVDKELTAVVEATDARPYTGNQAGVFGNHALPANMIGHCDPDCPDLVATYVGYVVPANIRVDPELSDHVCYACIGSAECRQKTRWLAIKAEHSELVEDLAEQVGDLATEDQIADYIDNTQKSQLKTASVDGLKEDLAKRQALQETEYANRKQLTAYLASLDRPADLFTNEGFVRYIMRRLHLDYDSAHSGNFNEMDIDELAERTFWSLIEYTAMRYNHELKAHKWDSSKVDQYLHELRGPVEQPGPGDSQDLDWETGWTDEDDAEWERLQDVPIKDLAADVTRYRVVIRLMSDAPKAVRSELWPILNKLSLVEMADVATTFPTF